MFLSLFVFFNHPATTEIYTYYHTLPLHDALPISMESALRRAKAYCGPGIVHAFTRKGNGYAHAENDVADRMHATGVIDPVTGRGTKSSAPDWTSEIGRAHV